MSKKAEIVIDAKNKSKQAFDSVESSLTRISKHAGKTAIGLAAVGGAAIVTGLVHVASETAKLQDEAIKTAQSVGVTTEALTGLQYAAELSGSSNDGLTKGLKTLSKNALEASQGVKTYSQDFAELGINVEGANGELKSADALLLEMADSFSQMEDGTKKTALAVSLLGGRGAQLIPLLNAGSKGVKEMTDEAERLGIVIDTKAARESEKFNDNLTRLQKGVDGAKIALGNKLLPILSDSAEYFVEATKDGLDFVDVLGAIGVAFDTAFNGAQITQQRNRIKELDVAIEGYEKKLTALGDSSNKRLIASVRGQNQRAQAERESLRASIEKHEAEEQAAQEQADAAAKANKALQEQKRKQEALKASRVAAAKSDAQAAASFVTNLQKQAETLGLSRTELLAFDAAHLKLSESQRRSVEASIASIEGFEAQQKAAEKAKAEIEEMDRLLQASDARELANIEEASAKEAERLAQNAKSFEEFYNNLEQQNQDLNIALISDDQIRAQEQLRIEHERIEQRITALMLEGDEADKLRDLEADRFKKSMDLLASNTKKAKDAAKDFGFTFNSQLEDVIINGGKAGDVIDALAADIQRMIIRKTVTEPLGDFVSEAIGSIDFGSIFANAKGGVYQSASLSQYSGQIVDSPKLFAFAKGAGLMGEAGPEAILPLQRGADGKLGVTAQTGGGVVVNVYNQGGNTEAEVQERDDGGVRIIDVLIKEVSNAQAAQMSAGKGALFHSVKNRFGLNPVAGATF